jgi:hypothetical protein
VIRYGINSERTRISESISVSLISLRSSLLKCCFVLYEVRFFVLDSIESTSTSTLSVVPGVGKFYLPLPSIFGICRLRSVNRYARTVKDSYLVHTSKRVRVFKKAGPLPVCKHKHSSWTTKIIRCVGTLHDS